MKFWFIAVVLTCAEAQTAELKTHTLQAFEQYIRDTEARIDGKLRAGGFLWTDEAPARLSQVRQGQVVTEPWAGKPETHVQDGIIHDWISAAFIPGATLKQTLATVQNYDNHRNVYRPEVIDSRLVSRNGNDFKIRLQLLKKKVITVVLSTEHEVRYFPLDAARCHSRSYSTRIAEVADYGKPGQHDLPAGRDHGFLWRLYSYWKFQERDGGVFVECQAISLTRGIPTGLGWLIGPIVRSLPRESLANTLEATRRALAR